MMLREKKKSEQVVSCLSGTFPPAHLSSAQSLAKFSEVRSALSAGSTGSCRAPGRPAKRVGSAAGSQTRRCQPRAGGAGQATAAAERPPPEPLTPLLLRAGNGRPGAAGGQLCGTDGPRAPPGNLNNAWVRNQRAAADRP